jgi:hypothetical protein
VLLARYDFVAGVKLPDISVSIRKQYEATPSDEDAKLAALLSVVQRPLAELAVIGLLAPSVRKARIDGHNNPVALPSRTEDEL